MLWIAPTAPIQEEEPTDFLPLPLLSNPHIQTWLGAYLPGPTCQTQRRHLVHLPDGDALVLHENTPRSWQPGDPLALLLHGLGGSAASPHIQRLAVSLMEHGVRVGRLDLRGAGDGVSLARNVYHAGRSDDIRAALEILQDWSPKSPLWLVGVSLGGALALRTAGELEDHPVPGLERVAALCPPIHLERCCDLLASPANRVYNQTFVRLVVTEARLRQKYFPDLPPLGLPVRLTFRDFDELYTAPRSGFAGALDYYRRACSYALVPRIPIPALMLTSRDDPFIAVEPFEELSLPSHMDLCIVDRGGHVGFVGRDSSGGVRWAERRIVDWLCSG